MTYNNNMNPTGTDAISFTIQGDTYSATHLVALVMSQAKKQAEAYGKDPVSGAVLTVPPYFNQFQRQVSLLSK